MLPRNSVALHLQQVPDGQEEHEVAEALFDLANMFAASEPAAIGSPRITAGPKSKRQRLKLQQQQERQAEQVGPCMAAPKSLALKSLASNPLESALPG